MPDTSSKQVPEASYVTSTGASRIDDPDVKLPKAVRQSVQNVEALHSQYYPKNTGQTNQSGSQDTNNTDTSNTDTSNADTGNTGNQSQPSQQASQQPPQSEPQNWEHAFKSVNGRYQKAQQTIQNLTARISDLEAALADREARLSAVQNQVQTQPSNVHSELTPEEISDYGEEFLNVVGKKAREIAASEIARLNERIEQLTAQLNGVSTNVLLNAREKMKSVLDSEIPNWREINENQDFLAWLGLKDPYSGIIRHDMLKAAWNANDANRVLAFFRGFITDDAAVNPQGKQAPITSTSNRPRLEQFAAPGRASNSGDVAPSPTTQKPIITRAQIAQFHRDVAQGKYRGREAERKAFDAAMIEAAREGRIQ